jgi:hypothetical protein
LNAIIFSYYLIFLKPKIYLIVVFWHSEHLFLLLVSFYNLFTQFLVSIFTVPFIAINKINTHFWFRSNSKTAKQQNRVICYVMQVMSTHFGSFSSMLVFKQCCAAVVLFSLPLRLYFNTKNKTSLYEWVPHFIFQCFEAITWAKI